MTLNRRRFLRITGFSAVIAAAGSAAWFTASREPTAALQPWSQAGAGYADPRQWALSRAILAPNAHNLQSWLVDLDDPDAIMLHVDHDRMLPETDPYSRQIMISLGCFLEILRMAAAERGFEALIERFPLGKPGDDLDRRPVARFGFRAAADIERDPLFAYVVARRSCKEAYDPERSITGEQQRRLIAASLGSPVQAVSQALQEYPEMNALYDEPHHRLGVAAPARVQMLARLGHGPAVPPAPRWSWQQRVMG